ncbi:alpha-1,6-mannosyltransferase subunit [Coprinopsis sp. MPI-PUGE-AT-0042]|nr:alpha-1,6-mannosyltransferase subunit [Coprinopsis sp. MPI-PUGE-AT-0042]
MSLVLDAFLVALGWGHILLAPYTKVEESFNLHAMHDVLMYGVTPNALSYFDHFVFPGAVPRTFIGSVLVAWAADPIIKVAASLGLVQHKLNLQITLRLVLGTVNALGLCFIRRAISKRFGSLTSLFFTLLTCSQFQLPFWMGRTVPNMFALFLVNMSTYFVLGGAPSMKHRTAKAGYLPIAILLLAFAAAVFRAEVALLLAPLALQMLGTGLISFNRLLIIGFVSSLVSVGLTILVDSYFWHQPLLWPEFSSIYFNVVQGKSSEWGTSPPLTYFVSFLPKLLLTALPLSAVGIVADARVRKLLVPSFTFITLISFLGHKEWRFIAYVVPIFNIAAARACAIIVSLARGTWTGRLLTAIVCGCLLANFAFTAIATWISSTNYPGGDAMQRLHALYPASQSIHVHISNLAAQTGASLFHQDNAPPYHPAMAAPLAASWTYNKTEGLQMDDLMSPRSPFTHLIVESLPAQLHPDWKVVDTIRTFNSGFKAAIDIGALSGAVLKMDHVALITQLQNVYRLLKRDALWILERV